MHNSSYICVYHKQHDLKLTETERRHIDGLVQERRVLAMELRLSCTTPSLCHFSYILISAAKTITLMICSEWCYAYRDCTMLFGLNILIYSQPGSNLHELWYPSCGVISVSSQGNRRVVTISTGLVFFSRAGLLLPLWGRDKMTIW